MNFTELYKKINSLDSGIDSTINECSCDDMGPDTPPTQPDNVNMNISINGQGSGGIRDLMDILRNIEKSDEPQHHDKPLHGDNAIVDEPVTIELNPDESLVSSMEPPQIEMTQEENADDSYANSVNDGSSPTKYAIQAVVGMGNDLASKGTEKKKVNGGGNPGAISETLINNLRSLYDEIKQSTITENRDLPGPGDMVTWPHTPSPKRKNHSDRMRGPDSHSDIDDNVFAKRSTDTGKQQKNVKNQYIDKEGKAPNGDKYNKIYLITASDMNSAKHQVDVFKKHEWGAKDIIDQKVKDNDDGSVSIKLYIVDKHKYGTWTPWQDQPPTSKPLSFS